METFRYWRVTVAGHDDVDRVFGHQDSTYIYIPYNCKPLGLNLHPPMSHTMNGKPIWCPPARTKDYTFDPIKTKEEDANVTLAEAAGLVRAAIRRGLIKKADKETAKAAKLGARSLWATCEQCQSEFSRDKYSSEKRCPVCRLSKKVCKVCGITFQPTQHKQKCCSVRCRTEVSREASRARCSPKIMIECAWCKNPFERRAQDIRKTNCSKECGFKSMAAKMRKK